MASLRLCLPSKSFAAPSVFRLKASRNQACVVSPFDGVASRAPLVNPLRIAVPSTKERKREMAVRSSVVMSMHTVPMSMHTLQWVSAISTGVLMVSRGTAIHKSFLVPLFALLAPASVVAWIKGEYGMWTAFLTLLVRLFYHIPDELKLPFDAMLFLITAPYQAMTLRGSQGGAIIALAIAAFLAYQHFSRMATVRKAFEAASIVPTLAIISILAVPFFFLF